MVCSSSLVASGDKSIIKFVLKLAHFSSLPWSSSANSASNRQNVTVISDRVQHVGPCVDALRAQAVPAGRKDVVR